MSPIFGFGRPSFWRGRVDRGQRTVDQRRGGRGGDSVWDRALGQTKRLGDPRCHLERRSTFPFDVPVVLCAACCVRFLPRVAIGVSAIATTVNRSHISSSGPIRFSTRMGARTFSRGLLGVLNSARGDRSKLEAHDGAPDPDPRRTTRGRGGSRRDLALSRCTRSPLQIWHAWCHNGLPERAHPLMIDHGDSR